MARRPNTRPTLIYWLVDTRTGIPFYCGKTVLSLCKRLVCHRYEATNGERRVHVKVRECGEHISIHEMESVPPDGDWVAREKRWIYILRETHPDICNTADGGAGAPGRIVSDETRAKLSEIFKGKSTHSAETRAYLSVIGMGRKRSLESVERSAAGNRGSKHSPESREKMSAAQKARYVGPRGDELRLQIGLRRKGVIASDETRAKQRDAKLGTKRTPEQCEAISAANIGKKMSAEAIAKSAASRKGQKRTPEQRATMSASHKGKKWSQAQYDARRAA